MVTLGLVPKTIHKYPQVSSSNYPTITLLPPTGTPQSFSSRRVVNTSLSVKVFAAIFVDDLCFFLPCLYVLDYAMATNALTMDLLMSELCNLQDQDE